MRIGWIVLIGIAACAREGAIMPVADGKLAAGTWGGENAGVIADNQTAHVHVGCTFGDFAMPVTLDESGHFSVPGNYVLRAYPIQTGPAVPAQFTGTVSGNRLVLSIAVNDTVEKKQVAVGPITVTFARDPKMQQCPICRR